MERLANRPKTSLEEIYKRWKCDLKSCKNYGHYCWIDNADDKHYAFDSSDASRWTKAIPEHASIDRPSDNLRAHLVRKDGKRRNVNVQNTTSSHGNIHNHFNLALPSGTPYYDRRYFVGYTPEATPRRRRFRHLSSSPRSNPDGHAEVDRYFNWLIDKYPVDNEKLLYAKSKIQEQDLDLKSVKLLNDKTFKEWLVTDGIADKIRRNIKTFQREDIY